MSQFISVFDMLKIGVGPSSSHTLGPWRAAQSWVHKIKDNNIFDSIDKIKVDLYGSLSLTGKGHATDIAILLGLSEADPEYIPIEDIAIIVDRINTQEEIYFKGGKKVPFYKDSIVFNRDFLPFHSNGVTFRGFVDDKEITTETYYSIGGGFIVQENNNLEQEIEINKQNFPYPINRAKQLEEYCEKENLLISDIVFKNELEINSAEKIDFELKRIWETMLECM